MALAKSPSIRPISHWPLWLVILANLLLAGALLFWPAAQTPEPAPDIVCPPATRQPGTPVPPIPDHCTPDRRTV